MTAPCCRDLFPVTKNLVFLNHAGMSAHPLTTSQAMQDFNRERLLYASKGFPRWMERVEEVRALVARLINARPEETAFTANTSSGLSLIAEGLDWRPGDEVVIVTPDFPSNVFPWLHLERRGVKVRRVVRNEGRFTTRDVEQHFTSRTRLLAVSTVDYASGFCSDVQGLGELCRDRGVLLGLDAIQSLGVLPMDVASWSVDFLASGAHKWLLGPAGTALLYVSERLVERLDPPLTGWRSVVNEEEFNLCFELKPDARRFENGCLNLEGIFGLGASLDLLLTRGIETIREEVFALNDHLTSGLRERGLTVSSHWTGRERSGILTFLPPGHPQECWQHLMDHHVMCSLRGGAIRLAPHFYNDDSDLEAFFTVLDEYLHLKSRTGADR